MDNNSSQSQSQENFKELLTEETNDIDNDVELSPTNKNIKETEKELPIPAIIHSTGTKSSKTSEAETITATKYDYNTYRLKIQENIEYNHFKEHQQNELDLVDELIVCMLDVICTDEATVKIGKENKNREMVRFQYLKINSSDIGHVIDRYKEQRHKIKHLHSYLKTMLFTVKQETGFYYTNAVRADGVVW